MIGTWHGQGVDLPELDALFTETGVTEPASDRIDIAYLAYCCWPLATRLRRALPPWLCVVN